MLLPLAVAIPLAAAAITPLLGRRLGRRVAIVDGLVLLALGIALLREVGPVVGGAVRTFSRPWLPSLGLDIALRLDALALVLALVVTLIGAAVMPYALHYFSDDDRDAVRVTALLTLFAGAMLGVVLADDLVLLFIAWELTSITSFFLIGGDGRGARSATRALLVTAIGGLALLAAAVLLSLELGTSSISEAVARAPELHATPIVVPLALLLLLAAGSKSAQFPLHFWLPSAMVAPTPVSTYLHAATMVKAGIYLVLRMAPLFDGVLVWHATLVVVGGTTAVIGAWAAVVQDDLKRLMAYSTVSQLGLLTALGGLGTPLALAIATIHVLAHALFKAALFMTVGAVEHATGTRRLTLLGGLRSGLPLTAAAGTLAALSMAGVPPLLGFVTKEEGLAALLEGVEGAPWIGRAGLGLIVVASIGTVAYSLRYVARTFLGPVTTPAYHASHRLELPALVLATTGLVLGPLSGRLTPLLSTLGLQLGGADPSVRLALWHGITTPLLISAVVLLSGAAAHRASRLLEALAARTPRPSGEDLFDRVHASILASGARVRRTGTSAAPAAYLGPLIGVLVLTLWAGTTRIPQIGTPPRSTLIDVGVVALVAASVAGVVQARSRIAAVAALGLTGFLVATWFALHGAPDLALTQLLVETLTVALVVVVFRRLPDTFARGGRRRRRGAATIAAVVGIGAGTLTWRAVGRTGRSELGTRFLEEAERITGGSNVVNTILVEFRALDTLGEVSVLLIATLGILALVRPPDHRTPCRSDGSAAGSTTPAPGGPGPIDSVILRVMTNVLVLALVGSAGWLLVRGHDEVGGGFIGGLAAGAAVVLLYLSEGHQRVGHSRRLRAVPLIGAGLLLAVTYGLAGLVLTGDFLTGGKLPLIGGATLAASLVFDLGVFLVVVGLVVGILRHLGQGLPEDVPAGTRGGPRTVPPIGALPDEHDAVGGAP